MARKEKNVTRAFEVTICSANTIKVYKQADENGNIPTPEMEPRTYTLLGKYTAVEALPVLRETEELHINRYDRIIVSVNDIKWKWQLRAVPYSSFFRSSFVLAEADTFEQLRAKKDGENDAPID